MARRTDVHRFVGSWADVHRTCMFMSDGLTGRQGFRKKRTRRGAQEALGRGVWIDLSQCFQMYFQKILY